MPGRSRTIRGCCIMARRKSAKKKLSWVAPEANVAAPTVASGDRHDETSFAPLPADIAIPLAWPVASIVNLESLFADEFHAKRTPEGYKRDDEVAINLDTGEIGLGRDEVQNILFIKISLSMTVAKKTAPAGSDPAIRVNCSFILVYSITSFDGLTNDQLAAFAQTSGIFNVWPYWRQVVHSASLQLGMPAIVLPTYRAEDPTTTFST